MLSFELHYQPIFFLLGGRLLGYEALLRPSPLELLARARAAGAIPMWELRVLERAAEEVLRSCDALTFVNLTPEAFSSANFAVRARRLLEAKGIHPSRVAVEVSESSGFSPAEGRVLVEEWKALGFFVALDDFGAGRSNLDLVLGADFDFVKVDRVLVHGISRDRGKQRIVGVLVREFLASGSFPVLEGVEDPGDLAWLRETGWDVGVQGFALARPSSAPQALVERGRIK
ncbi:EAL domain-containing protein [Ammonifex thiophilus]|uniref:EAL domain-containing protein n=1 Tax=Ammonifex thiophilus TaxID=444093 RepID=UPI001402DC22|nr:EAL domain-containing protein [Ammonifex thiophilus]